MTPPPAASPNPRVSLAHAGRGAVAAGSITLPSAGIGIDLAADCSANPRTARFFLDDMEKAWLAATPTRARATEFTRLRTVKGAVFKADVANRTAVLSNYAIRPVGGRVGLGRRRGTGQHFGFSSAQFQGAHLSVAAASGLTDPYPVRRGRLAPVTFENVAERVSATLKVPAAGLTPETTVRELAADSFHLAEIAVDLSEEYETVFAQAELREVVSLGQLVSLLHGNDRHPGP